MLLAPGGGGARPYLSPVPGLPHGGAVEAVAGLDGPGLRVPAVLLPRGPGGAAGPGRLLDTLHGAAHQTHAAGGGAGSPLSGDPPVRKTVASEQRSTRTSRTRPPDPVCSPRGGEPGTRSTEPSLTWLERRPGGGGKRHGGGAKRPGGGAKRPGGGANRHREGAKGQRKQVKHILCWA